MFFYGYSNDFPANLVDGIGNKITSFLGFYQGLFKYVTYVNARFDLKNQDEEQIFYHGNLSSFATSIRSYLPDPTLGFTDSTTGSNVAMVLRKFLSTKPPCGTFVLLSLKRHSHDPDLSDIIKTLQDNKIFVFSFASTEMLGSSDSGEMYKVSSESNGLFIYDTEPNFAKMNGDLLWAFGANNPWYSTNLMVHGKGSTELPPLLSPPSQGYISVAVTVQNHPRTSNFQFMAINFESSRSTFHYNLTIPADHGTCYMNHEPFDFTVSYKVTLDYVYSDQTSEAVEVRMYTSGAVNKWPPYSN